MGEFVGDAFVDADDGSCGMFPGFGDRCELADIFRVDSYEREDANECVGSFGLCAHVVTGLAQADFVFCGVGLHVGGNVAVVRCAVVAEDAPAHAAVVFSVPEGEGCAAGVALVHVLVVDPRVWQAWWDVHILQTDCKDIWLAVYYFIILFFTRHDVKRLQGAECHVHIVVVGFWNASTGATVVVVGEFSFPSSV